MGDRGTQRTGSVLTRQRLKIAGLVDDRDRQRLQAQLLAFREGAGA
jgi:hypothetical protein